MTAFGNRDYWLARLAAYGGDSMVLKSLVVDSDGAISVSTEQDLRHDMLPGGLAKALPGDLKILRDESWWPVEDGAKVRGDVRIDARGIPGSGSGTTVLSPRPCGSSLRFHGELTIRIPLVGGRIEKFVADLISREVPEMQRFTTAWIADHA